MIIFMHGMNNLFLLGQVNGRGHVDSILLALDSVDGFVDAHVNRREYSQHHFMWLLAIFLMGWRTTNIRKINCSGQLPYKFVVLIKKHDFHSHFLKY